jgi:CHASE2 domain-containing sensor protein
MLKYLFKRDTLLATVAVFIVMGLLALLPFNTHILDPFKLALQDFDYNDMAYSKLEKNKAVPVDTNIVIVNIGNADRMTIAGIIQKAASADPKVIGLDVIFNEKKDSASDQLLNEVLSSESKLVMAYSLQSDHHGLKHEGHFFESSDNKGFVNFVGEEGGVIRHVVPAVKESKYEYIPFGAAVVKKLSLKKYQAFLERKQGTEIINYTSSADKFIVMDGADLLTGNADAKNLTGKIVLLGYVSSGAYDIEDMHFTPMNEKFVGKSLPDLNGVFVHANIIKMILEENYVKTTPAWINWIVAVLLCWLHMAFFIRFYLDKHLWFHLAAKTAQILSAILFVYLGLLVFYKFNIKANMTITLVAIILAVDVLYFYEAFCTWLHKKTGYKTIFAHASHH